MNRAGPICAGWQRAPHFVESLRLVLDHANGATLDAGVVVLCQSCNNSKGSQAIPADWRVVAVIDDVPVRWPR